MLPVVGKRGHDSESDAELWARVAGTARPLRKGAVAPTRRLPVPGKAANEAEPPPQPPVPKVKVPPKAAPTARGEALDRQTARQLERGRLPVEARLDLHGMRQRDAHAALRRFLKSAQGRGYRHVLVITGKGMDPNARRSFYEEDERGVLRQAVPHWLAAPDLACVVVSFAPAPRRLGGEGALYVRLRKARP
jgi:DNA-nicking Smr family endonuclease